MANGHRNYDTYGNWSDDYLDGLNTSIYPFPNTIWRIKPSQEVAIKTVILIIIAVPGIIMNAVILVTLLKNRWLWTPTHLLLGNMAFVDFITLTFCPWFMLVRDIFQNFVLKNFGCSFEGFMQATFLLENVFAIVLVSYDRLAAARLPSEARVTRRAAPKLIAASWAVSCMFALPWTVSREYVERQWLDHLESFCVENPEVLIIYWQFILLLLVYVPLGTMAVTVDGRYSILWFASNSLLFLNCTINPLIYGFTNSKILKAMDRTPGVACCKFGSWCCIYSSAPNKQTVHLQQGNNTEKIFIIEASPRPEKKFSKVIKNLLHINADRIELSIGYHDKFTNKSTKVTPLKTDLPKEKPETKPDSENNNDTKSEPSTEQEKL